MNRISATTALAALALTAACTDGTTAPTKTAIAPRFDHVSGDASAGTAVYNNIPRRIPPNVPSLGYQATQTAEFGDYVRLAGTARRARSATVLMSNWALNSNYPSMGAAGYTHPITLNIYNVNLTGSVPALGAKIGTVTQTFLIPWRPEADPTCEGGTAWRASDHLCYNGFAFTITFDLSSLALTLPSKLIVGIAYNTNTWGYSPLGLPGPYESLNVGLVVVPPSVGTDVERDALFWNTKYAPYYADLGAGGTGTFRRDWNWTYSPAFSISAFTVATTDDECKKDGWRSLARTDGSSFKNQGDCVSDGHDGKPEHHDRDQINVGPVAIVGVDDIGTCNNVWALDSFDKFYTLTPNDDGTYSLQVNYKKGTFVTIAGASPGACEVTGGNGPGNGNTVGAGITGRMHQEWNATVTATGTPNRNPNCGRNNANCLTATSFLTAVFGSVVPIGPWSYEGHYEAGSNGTWFDTFVNWPFNDRGDITGTKNHERDHGDGRGGDHGDGRDRDHG